MTEDRFAEGTIHIWIRSLQACTRGKCHDGDDTWNVGPSLLWFESREDLHASHPHAGCGEGQLSVVVGRHDAIPMPKDGGDPLQGFLKRLGVLASDGRQRLPSFHTGAGLHGGERAGCDVAGGSSSG